MPRSSKLIYEDNDYALYSVTLFKRVADSFKQAARSKGFQVLRQLSHRHLPPLTSRALAAIPSVNAMMLVQCHSPLWCLEELMCDAMVCARAAGQGLRI